MSHTEGGVALCTDKYFPAPGVTDNHAFFECELHKGHEEFHLAVVSRGLAFRWKGSNIESPRGDYLQYISEEDS